MSNTVPADGEKIKELRLALGLSQEEFAEKAECSRRSISNAEKGRNLSITTLKCIADAFGVSPKELFRSHETESLIRKYYPIEEHLHLSLVLNSSIGDFNISHPAYSLLEVIAKTLSTSSEITILDARNDSPIVTLAMGKEDALKLASLFADFPEIARAAIRGMVQEAKAQYPQLQERLQKAISRKQDGKFYATSSLTGIVYYLAHLCDLLTASDSLSELRLSIDQPEGSRSIFMGERFQPIRSMWSRFLTLEMALADEDNDEVDEDWGEDDDDESYDDDLDDDEAESEIQKSVNREEFVIHPDILRMAGFPLGNTPPA